MFWHSEKDVQYSSPYHIVTFIVYLSILSKVCLFVHWNIVHLQSSPSVREKGLNTCSIGPIVPGINWVSLEWVMNCWIMGDFREGNGNPLQYSCLENPMDGGAWWAAVHGLLRVRHDWATSLSLFTFMHQRRKWQPTPVFLPGESHGWGSLVGCRLWGRTESDTTEVT